MVFKKPEKNFVAYADKCGRNEFLVRTGKNYYILTSQKNIHNVSAEYAERTLKLIKEQVLTFRGMGSFQNSMSQ